MKSIRNALLFGFVGWLVPFIVAFAVFPLREADRPFFESIMPVTGVLTAVVLSVIYFRKVETDFLREGVLLGLVFLGVSWVIDLLMFSRGPMAMTLSDYVKDIGFTYLAMPVITVGIGYSLHLRSSG